MPLTLSWPRDEDSRGSGSGSRGSAGCAGPRCSWRFGILAVWARCRAGGGDIMKRVCLGLTVSFVALVVALSGSAVSVAEPPVNTDRFVVNPAALPFNPLPGTSTTRYWGITDGAGWRIEVPDGWNGDLVLSAHGSAGLGDLLAVQSPGPGLRGQLVASGYAWAASSYRANGYVPETGAEDTYNLLKIFQHEVGKDTPGGKKGASGKPNRVYLFGV